MLLACRQSRCELGPIAVLAALDLDKFLRQQPRAAVQIVQHGFPLGVQAEARFALPVGRDPEICDEFPPVRRHWSLPSKGDYGRLARCLAEVTLQQLASRYYGHRPT